MTKGYYRKAHDRKDGTHVRGTYVKSSPDNDWIQSVDATMEKRGTVGVFTRAKLAAAKKFPRSGFTDTKRGTVKFANAILAGKIPGKKSELWKDRARLAKVFVRISRK